MTSARIAGSIGETSHPDVEDEADEEHRHDHRAAAVGELVQVLLAEDDDNLGTLLRNYLEAKTFETSLYSTGKSALKAFSAGKYDLCILDIMMPEMDGYEVVRRLPT